MHGRSARILKRILPWRLRVAIATLVDAPELIAILYTRGDVSDLTCASHQTVPMTVDEVIAVLELEEGDLTPCIHYVRIWPEALREFRS